MEDGYEASDGVPTDEHRCECDGLGGWHCKQRRVQDSRFCNMHQNVYQLRNDRLRRERAGSRKYLFLNEGQLVEVISKDVSLVDAWFTAKIIQLLPDRKNKIKVLIQYCSLLSGVDPLTEKVNSSLLRPPPPPLQNKSFQLHQFVDAFCENGWWKGEIVETLENNTYSVYYSVWEEKKIFVADDLRIHQDWIGGKWVIPPPMDRVVKKEDIANLSEDPERTMPSRTDFTQGVGDVRNTDILKDPPILKDPARTGIESCTSSNSMETNFTDGIDVYVFLRKNKLRHHPEDMFRCPLRILSDHQMTNCIQEQSTCAPSFNVSGTPETIVYCSVSDEAHGELSKSQIQRPQTSSDFRSPPQSTESFYGDEINQQQGVMAKKTNAILETKSPSKETVLDSSAIDLQSITPCREVALAHHNQVASQSETEIIQRETLMVLLPQGEGGFDHNKSQDRTDIFTKTLLVYQGSHHTRNSSPGISTSILDSDRLVDPTRYVESSMSDGEQGDEVSLEDGTLLFTKTLSLWKTLETMEVFQSMPQKPHFRTLAELNENLREGRAISFMLSFFAVVEKTQTLQFNEPRSSIIETLMVLNDLEAIGFHVQPIRARLEKLLSIQTVLLELDVEMKQVEEEIIKENIEENPLEIDEITENLRNFQKLSAEMMKKQEMLVMKKQANDSDVAVLQKSIQEAEKEIQDINLQFSSVAASLG